MLKTLAGWSIVLSVALSPIALLLALYPWEDLMRGVVVVVEMAAFVWICPPRPRRDFWAVS